MATRADDLKDTRTEHAEAGAKAPARSPLRTRVTSTQAVIERAVARHRKALDLLAKR